MDKNSLTWKGDRQSKSKAVKEDKSSPALNHLVAKVSQAIARLSS